MKATMICILGVMLKLLWPSYAKMGSSISPFVVIKCWFVQKVLGVNRKVDWPVHWTTEVKSPDRIIRGTRCPGLSRGCHIDGRNGIELGENVWIGPHVCIISMNHDVINFDKYQATSPIVIGSNCWLGAKAVVLPGVSLEEHIIVAAGSVVTRSFVEKNQIIGGVPAKHIKYIGEYGK